LLVISTESCVMRVGYFIKLSALARKQFVGPSLFVSIYALNQFTNKAISTLPELPFINP